MNKTTRKVLIMIDVQNDFITGSLKNEGAIATLPNIVKLLKEKKFDKTYVTMDTHDNNYLNTLEGKNLPVKHCIYGTDGWNMPNEINEALKHQNVVQVFEKPTFGSVYLADCLDATLHGDEYDINVKKEDYEFTIIGYCTDICVVSNALNIRAHFPNNKITVLRDCTAGVTPESNENALNTMKMCQIDII